MSIQRRYDVAEVSCQVELFQFLGDLGFGDEAHCYQREFHFLRKGFQRDMDIWNWFGFLLRYLIVCFQVYFQEVRYVTLHDVAYWEVLFKSLRNNQRDLWFGQFLSHRFKGNSCRLKISASRIHDCAVQVEQYSLHHQ